MVDMSNSTTARNSVDHQLGKTELADGPFLAQESVKAERDLETGSLATNTHDEAADPNVVDWDGPDDPENPMNWSQRKKLVNVVLVSLLTFITPLASSIFAPAIELVMTDFNETSTELASFIVSVYLLGYCCGPLIIAPLSEIYGRVPLYHSCNILFLIWSIACAVAPSLNALIAFRFLAGIVGSCPMIIGAGTIADIIPQEKRGKYMAGWIFGPLWGPIVGPTAGGYLAEAAGWRWSMWLVVILAGLIFAPGFLFLRETYAVLLLERKAERLRKETGNPKLRSRLSTDQTRKEMITTAIVRPTKMLLFSPVSIIMAVYLAFMYGQLYILFTALSYVFETAYSFGTGTIGLMFLGPGVGAFIGIAIAGSCSDRLMQRLVKRNGGAVLPKYRLPMAVVGGALCPIGMFIFGWAADQRAHWMIPLIGTVIFCCGMVVAMMAVQTYLVDAFEQYAASATAANTVFRSLVGALLPLSGRRLFQSLGIGWGNSVLGFIGLALVPCPLFLYLYGERIRHKTLFNVKL